MKNIFENFASRGYVKRSFSKRKEELSGQQNPSGEISEKDLSREQGEDSIGKLDLFEVAVAQLAGKLELPDNARIIDGIVGEGASYEMGEKLINYWEKLGAKKVISEDDSSAKEILRNLELKLFVPVERVKIKGINDDWREVIKEEFNNLKEYVELLEKYADFERAELSTVAGFLGKGKEKKVVTILRSDKAKYIKTCKNILQGNN